jgi:SulP family sulfate permease
VRIERIVPLGDGGYTEDAVPEKLSSGDIVMLQPIGSLFFAGTAEFEEHLPEVGEAQRSVVIIRLREREEVGSTFIRTIERYAQQLLAQGNKLMLVGVEQHVLEQLDRTELLDLIGEENVFLAQARIRASLEEALAAAEAWIAQSGGRTEGTSSESQEAQPD